ncbi:MAG: hypothetical protein ACC652_15380 [Acidimicrobiales bacterium]
MARSSSTRKVAKVASSSPKRREQGDGQPRGFQIFMVVLLIAGLTLVYWAREQRATEVNVAGASGQTIAVTFGIYICDEFVDFDEVETATQIVTVSGNTVTVDPQALTSGGGRARIQSIYDRVGVDVDEGKIVLEDGTEYLDGAECDGDPGTVQLAKFNASHSTSPDDVFTSNLGGTALATEGQIFVLAFVADGTEIPQPTTSSMG